MKCALCAKGISDEYKPFCSKRCSDVDLHRWTSGVYAIPTEENADISGVGEDEY